MRRSFFPQTLDMGKEEINAPPHATRAPPFHDPKPSFPGIVAELTAHIQTSVSARASRPPTSLHLIPPDFSSQQQQRSQDQGPDQGWERRDPEPASSRPRFCSYSFLPHPSSCYASYRPSPWDLLAHHSCASTPRTRLGHVFICLLPLLPPCSNISSSIASFAN
ncbi:uncharacterized protein CLUP02_06106 [Colletotrichum lupini]|uniref:Uncharacterized protein n=1 Tax=Colletotrichum lupini TaxID=145971 RepID=A0A9Q8SNP5_9PEZI|nr:uncharacterized protein CLUP02_06106 [Colletotrichum lupini]UQC80623.1 hypothetical protein CLUP02_06106 [Colletotrichum lupini]